MSKLFFNKKGQSSITVIILAGLVITLSAGAYISYLSLVREEKAGREKMSALDLEQKMIMSMGGNSCLADLVNTNLNPSAPYRLNTTSKNTLAQTNINLNKLHSSAANSTNAIAEQDKPASSMNKDVLIDQINLKNVQPTATANQYSIDIEITFKGNNLVRQISPVILTKNIFTDPADPVTAQRISCSPPPPPIINYQAVYTSSGTDCKTLTCPAATPYIYSAPLGYIQGNDPYLCTVILNGGKSIWSRDGDNCSKKGASGYMACSNQPSNVADVISRSKKTGGARRFLGCNPANSAYCKNPDANFCLNPGIGDVTKY